MRSWQCRLIAAITATFMVLGTGTAAPAVSDEEAVLIPGGLVFKQINPQSWLLAKYYYPDIGNHFHNDDDPVVIDYSQDVLAIDRAVRDGVARAADAVREIDDEDDEVVVIGESMGSMVASRFAVQLANSSDPPSTDDLRVVLIAPPEAGILKHFTAGTFIPILNYRASRVPESPYPTTIVIGEYDGWADPPDRPWNLVSLLNAALGTAFVHDKTTALSDPADVPPENIKIERNSLGATVTTYLVPTENLPLTQLGRMVGVPDEVVDKVDEVLRPMIDAGYRRHDQPGDTRPYLSEGQIVRDVQSQPEVADRRIERTEQRRQIEADAKERVAQDVEWLKQKKGERRAIRAERRQRIDAEVRERVAQVTQKIAERRELRSAIRVQSQQIEADVKERVAQKKVERHELHSAIRGERRQQIRSDVTERVVHGIQLLKQKRVERQAERADR